MIYSDIKQTKPITCIQDWEEAFFVANKAKHWKDKKSAKETAKVWLDGSMPLKLDELFKANPITIEMVVPEHESPLDNYRGMGRVHDLLIVARENLTNERIVIGVESKVNEPFGNETVSQYFFRKQLQRLGGRKTNVPSRINILILSLFKDPSNELIGDLRYQLLTAAAGTLVEAKNFKAKKAVLLVQTVLTDSMDSYQHHINQIEVDKFVTAISGGKQKIVQHDEIVGPFKVPGNSKKFVDEEKCLIPGNKEFYIGKVELKVKC